jgi:hypothetical protein
VGSLIAPPLLVFLSSISVGGAFIATACSVAVVRFG